MSLRMVAVCRRGVKDGGDRREIGIVPLTDLGYGGSPVHLDGQTDALSPLSWGIGERPHVVRHRGATAEGGSP